MANEPTQAALREIACWGDEATPLQVAGKPPILHSAGKSRIHDDLWRYAGGHLGFYGYLRSANHSIEIRTGFTLLDFSDFLWRDHYDAHTHPVDAAREFLAKEMDESGCGDLKAELGL